MEFLRYDETEVIGTDLDPIEDLLNFMITLKSSGFTSDLLREVHGFTINVEIKRTAKLIGLHINTAVGLALQAFEGPPETSFLPLYYSTLNFAKVYLLMMGRRIDLESNRWHGAKYHEEEMTRKFLNEKISITSKGTIPLIYKSITGESISRSGLTLTLNEIYRNISSIEVEFNTITKQKPGTLCHSMEIVDSNTHGHHMKIEIFDDFYKINPPMPRTLRAYPGLRIITDSNGESHYETKRYTGRYETVKRNLLSKVKRCLISDFYNGSWYSLTPISGRKHVLNEELSIMLAYFHLSNVIRYNPEHFYKLMDSKYWSILLGLRKHGFLRFEKLLWGNFIKKSFDIS